MARKVVQFVRVSPKGEYRIADLRQLVDNSYQKEKQKGVYQIAEISQEQYKELENGKVLRNKDLGFVDMVSAQNAISENDLLKSENESILEENQTLQAKIRALELASQKANSTKKAKAVKAEPKVEEPQEPAVEVPKAETSK